jgi:DNA-directed RNA polymerase specialized sigma24 family protein
LGRLHHARRLALKSENPKAWELSSGSFAKLMTALHPEPDSAGERYEQLRRKLVRFFEWRGSAIAHELADETLNRLVRKIDEGEVIRDLSAYVGGMARLIWLEALKKQEREQEAFERLSASNQYAANTESPRSECFDFCLESLPAESRALILDYYREARGARIELRKQLAGKLGKPLNALRIRAHRIRAQLEACVADCLRKAE